MLATSRDTTELKKRESILWRMTWRAVSARPYLMTSLLTHDPGFPSYPPPTTVPAPAAEAPRLRDPKLRRPAAACPGRVLAPRVIEPGRH